MVSFHLHPTQNKGLKRQGLRLITSLIPACLKIWFKGVFGDSHMV